MYPQEYATAWNIVRNMIEHLIAIMEEGDFDKDDTIDTDSLEFEVNGCFETCKNYDNLA